MQAFKKIELKLTSRKLRQTEEIVFAFELWFCALDIRETWHLAPV